MARLTRTEKYANLRNQLENDRETQIKTEDLSKFEDKLEQLNVDINNETVTEEKKELNNSLDDILKQMNVEVSKHLDDDNLKEDSILDIEEEIEPEIFEEDIDDPIIADEEDSSVSEEVLEPVVDTPVETEEIDMENTESEINEETQEVNDSKQETTIQSEESETLNEETKEPEIKESISIEDLMKVDIDDNYLKDTLNEVKAYNKSIGSLTVDEVPKSILNEIRGVSYQEEDDDLSNTVTLEIKKILSELDEDEFSELAEPKVEENIPEVIEEVVEKPSYEAIPEVKEEIYEGPLVADETIKRVEPIVSDTKTELDDIRKAMETLPKDVSDLLRAYLEGTQEDALNPIEEVKTVEDAKEQIDNTVIVNNIAEVKEENAEVLDASNEDTVESVLMNETMPLQVENTNVYQKEEVEDEEEESSSSKIMNTVLIILIIILVLVLIVVAYLILVAQNIIPSLF